MAIAALTGTATSTAKISDLNALITAINTEVAALDAKLVPLATKAAVDELKARVAVLEAKVIPPDLTTRVTALEQKPDPVIPPDLSARVTALEAEPDVVLPPDLSDRVTALEAAVADFRIPPVAARTDEMSMLSPIPHQRRDPAEGIELIYDKATLYLGDMDLHALRIAEETWRLVAQLNYITVNQIIWTYDEIVHGTPDEVYRHAARRLAELAELKIAHDAAHARVREMSEGMP